ncbi:MAG: pyridoxamine 5'-phosphate oxidase family protein [Nocardioidaceae bacterium]
MSDLVELTTQECWELLAGEEIARVALATPVGPRIVPVNFTVHDGDLYFRTKPYSILGTYGRDGELAAEVDLIDRAARAGWSVQVTGRGTMITDPDQLRQVRAGWDPQPWADGQRYLYIRLAVRDIHGRRLTPRPATAQPVKDYRRAM